jgi:hypothetical protein
MVRGDQATVVVVAKEILEQLEGQLEGLRQRRLRLRRSLS